MLFAAAKRELSANGTAASQYRDCFHSVRIELRPAEPISGPIPYNPGSTIAAAAMWVFEKIHKQ